ncbi:MAG: DNA repair protein RadC [Clostridia bacterium]|nr:DNA repair protein RadC [Clostridia bacterium]
MGKEQSIHAGHRQRLKQAMLASDFQGMSDINLLEAVLFYSIPRGNTNEIAHHLLETFGSVEAVFEADYHNLLQVQGIGPQSAFLIKLMSSTAKRIKTANPKKAIRIDSPTAAAQIFEPYFIGEKDETMLAMYLDNAGKFIAVEVLGSGVVNTVAMHNRKLVEGCIRTNCATVILAHNHPHGVPNPSNQDLSLTHRIREALRTIGVSLYDHMIYADGEWRCVRERDDYAMYLTKIQL